MHNHHNCCKISGDRVHVYFPEKPVKGKALYFSLVSLRDWLLPGSILILLPKCPLCIAGLLTIITGMSFSMALVAGIQWFLLFSLPFIIYLLITNHADRSHEQKLIRNTIVPGMRSSVLPLVFLSALYLLYFFNSESYVALESGRVIQSCPLR